MPKASVLRLDRRAALNLDMRDTYSVHRVVYELFPEKEKRDFLFCDLGIIEGSHNILILSGDEPQQPRFGILETKEVPENFYRRNMYKFSVIIAVSQLDEKGKQYSVPLKDVPEWFCKKGEANGFSVDKDLIQVTEANMDVFVKPDGHNVTIPKVKIVGFLTVTDKAKFEEACLKGIGRARGFGYGLMQVVPLA